MKSLTSIVVAGSMWIVPALALPTQHQHSPTPAPAADSVSVPLHDDLGDHHHPVTTSSPEAQRYFDQGLRFVYAFNHDEAERSFRQAARLDPACPMAWWGVALSLGPNINLPIDPDRNRS